MPGRLGGYLVTSKAAVAGPAGATCCCLLTKAALPPRHLLHPADQTEAYNGHTIPQFPEKGEDVNLAGVRACLHPPGSCGGLGAEQHRALEHQRIPAALRLLLPLETEGARLISCSRIIDRCGSW